MQTVVKVVENLINFMWFTKVINHLHSSWVQTRKLLSNAGFNCRNYKHESGRQNCSLTFTSRAYVKLFDSIGKPWNYVWLHTLEKHIRQASIFVTFFISSSSLYLQLACVPVHYARVPSLCMNCAIVSNFPSEKRSRHSVVKIVVWVCSAFFKKTKLANPISCTYVVNR